MTELVFIKTLGGALMPGDPTTSDYVEKMKLGAAVSGEFKKVRNIKFHRKGFALFHFAFDHWEPEPLEYKGEKVQKEFNQFRKDLTVLAGFYTTSINLKGEVRLNAKSLNFKSMDDEEFEQVYNAIVNVVLSKILRNYTRDDLDNVINNLMGFI